MVRTLASDLKRRGILLTLLIGIQLYGVVVFAPAGFYDLLLNQAIITEPNVFLIILEYVFTACILLTTFFLLVGIVLWSKKMALFFIIFSFIIVLFEFLLKREQTASLLDLLFPFLWIFALTRKWSHFR